MARDIPNLLKNLHKEHIYVSLLDGKKLITTYDKTHSFQNVYNFVCDYFSIFGTNLFGLAVLLDDCYYFVNLSSKISKHNFKKQCTHPDLNYIYQTHDANGALTSFTASSNSSCSVSKFIPTLHFRVEKYLHPDLIEGIMSGASSSASERTLYFQQMLLNVRQHNLLLSDEVYFQLGALACQALHGNATSSTNTAHEVSPIIRQIDFYQFLPTQFINSYGFEFVRTHLPELHRGLAGMCVEEAQLRFIKLSSMPHAPFHMHLCPLLPNIPPPTHPHPPPAARSAKHREISGNSVSSDVLSSYSSASAASSSPPMQSSRSAVAAASASLSHSSNVQGFSRQSLTNPPHSVTSHMRQPRPLSFPAAATTTSTLQQDDATENNDETDVVAITSSYLSACGASKSDGVTQQQQDSGKQSRVGEGVCLTGFTQKRSFEVETAIESSSTLKIDDQNSHPRRFWIGVSSNGLENLQETFDYNVERAIANKAKLLHISTIHWEFIEKISLSPHSPFSLLSPSSRNFTFSSSNQRRSKTLLIKLVQLRCIAIRLPSSAHAASLLRLANDMKQLHQLPRSPAMSVSPHTTSSANPGAESARRKKSAFSRLHCGFGSFWINRERRIELNLDELSIKAELTKRQSDDARQEAGDQQSPGGEGGGPLRDSNKTREDDDGGEEEGRGGDSAERGGMGSNNASNNSGKREEREVRRRGGGVKHTDSKKVKKAAEQKRRSKIVEETLHHHQQEKHQEDTQMVGVMGSIEETQRGGVQRELLVGGGEEREKRNTEQHKEGDGGGRERSATPPPPRSGNVDVVGLRAADTPAQTVLLETPIELEHNEAAKAAAGNAGSEE